MRKDAYEGRAGGRVDGQRVIAAWGWSCVAFGTYLTYKNVSAHSGSHLARGLAQVPVSSNERFEDVLRLVEKLRERSGAAVSSEVLVARGGVKRAEHKFSGLDRLTTRASKLFLSVGRGVESLGVLPGKRIACDRAVKALNDSKELI